MANINTYLRKKKTALNTLAGLEAFKDTFDENDRFEIPVRLELIDQCKQDFVNIMSKLEELNEELVDNESHIQERSSFDKRYCVIKGFLLHQSAKEIIPSANSTFNATTGSGTFGGAVHLRLPKIELPSFNGEATKWLTFKDRFISMIHSATEIPAVMKLQYLLASLVGEAATHFEHTEVIADNYSVTWDALLKRYDNKKALVREYYRALHFLPRMQSDHVDDLARLVDDFTRHVKGLRKLGEPIDHWDVPLTNLLFLKMDKLSIVAWEEVGAERDGYADLVKFLEDRVRMLKSSMLLEVPPGSSILKVAGTKGSGTVDKPSNDSATNKQSRPLGCPLSCAETHHLNTCPVFALKTVKQRQEAVKQHKLCWNCLRTGHAVKNCISKFTCHVCKGKHHSLLHDPAAIRVSMTVHAEEGHQNDLVLLETAIVDIVDDYGHVFKARALLDSGSMSNFMTQSFAKQLLGSRTTININVRGIGNNTTNVKSAVTSRIQTPDKRFATSLQFLVLNHNLTPHVPIAEIDISTWKLPNVELADSRFNVPAKIDVIIGGEAYWELHSGRKMTLGRNRPWLTETAFGWTVAGSAASTQSCVPRLCSLSTATDSLDCILKRFWELEHIDDSTSPTVEDAIEHHYTTTTTRDSSGRYIVALPWNKDPGVVLGESKTIADRRLNGMERRWERNSALKTAYLSFMEEYLRLGHMRKLEEPIDDNVPHCYIPHHAVFKESSSSTKIRVVFDASCKTNSGYALNDALLVGPVIQNDLFSILLRFRIRRIAIAGDIEKMYRQILHGNKDRNFLRIRFRKERHEPIATYELQTVTYGTASAPYLATRTLQQIAKDVGHSFPSAVEPVLHDFYVDDLLSGADDEITAKTRLMQISEMLNLAGMKIRKWASNSLEVLQDVPICDRAIQHTHDLQDPSVSTLGLIWDTKSDTLRFQVHLPNPEPNVTKRMVLSYIARTFDPLGLLGPTILVAKLFMQRLWALNRNGNECEWDTVLPPLLQREWREFHSNLHLLRNVQVPRFVTQPKEPLIHLHMFADASKTAYGACCYVRTEGINGTTVNLLTAKSKVVSLKNTQSIARLELCAAQLSVQLYDKVKKALKIDPVSTFWTDSTTVYHWLQSPPLRWKSFVANRVANIQQSSDIKCWRHVAGIDNPADDISRGLSPKEILKSTRWWHGPSWLSLSPDNWPTILPSEEKVKVQDEERKTTVPCFLSAQSNNRDSLFVRYSCFTKLRRVVAYCLRFVDNCRSYRRTSPSANCETIDVIPTWLSTSELQRAELQLCKLAQSESFMEDIIDLTTSSKISHSSRLKRLHPFLDDHQILRVGGRLANAQMPQFVKHPIVLSAKHPLSTLLVTHIHKRLLHGGPQLMLSTLSQKFWLIGGRNLTRSVYHRCLTCFRSKPELVNQSMADLPSSRVSPTRPFSVCGVDYCGPFYIKPGGRCRSSRKAYVAIFVCFATKAVHIELVGDLTTTAFIAALRRFVARRGRVVELHSDNATNFKGASHKLHRVHQMLKIDAKDREGIFNWCSENDIRWKFIPPRAPHFGGLWEAAVKSFKRHLLREIGNVNLGYEEMLTLIAQIEMCLNSRPLTSLSTDPADFEVLTPGHFLVGCNLQAIPEVDLKEMPDNRLPSFERVQKLYQHIWSRWHKEYLQMLQTRAKRGCVPSVDMKINQIVLVKEDNVPPTNWPIARIVNLHPGKDGVCRVVSLRNSAGKIVVRPVSRLSLIPSPISVSDQ